MTNIAIIGGGQGGTALLGAFWGIEEYRIIGICDVNLNAAGIKLARELGVAVYQDLSDLMRQQNLELIIEATGSEGVREQLLQLKPASASLIVSKLADVMTFLEGQEKVLKRTGGKKKAFQTLVSWQLSLTFKETMPTFAYVAFHYLMRKSEN